MSGQRAKNHREEERICRLVAGLFEEGEEGAGRGAQFQFENGGVDPPEGRSAVGLGELEGVRSGISRLVPRALGCGGSSPARRTLKPCV